MKEIFIRDPQCENESEDVYYVTDRAQADLISHCEYLYYYSPKGKGKETAFNLKGLVIRGRSSDTRIITGIAHGETQNSFSSVENPPDTLDSLDQAIKNDGQNIVGAGHTHPFPNGHEFISWTDKENMRTFGSLDPGHIFLIVNPITAMIGAYRWDSEKQNVERITYKVIDTRPVTVRSAEPTAENAPKQEHNRSDHELGSIPQQTSMFSNLIAQSCTVMLGLMSIALIFIGIQDLGQASGLLFYAAGLLGIVLTEVYVLQKALRS
jgi:hypothetical protein